MVLSEKGVHSCLHHHQHPSPYTIIRTQEETYQTQSEQWLGYTSWYDDFQCVWQDRGVTPLISAQHGNGTQEAVNCFWWRIPRLHKQITSDSERATALSGNELVLPPDLTLFSSILQKLKWIWISCSKYTPTKFSKTWTWETYKHLFY